MEFVRFKNDNNIYIVDFEIVKEHVISLTFNVKIPESLLNGFEQLNKDNGIPEGDYTEYTTLYRKYNENPNTVELSDDGSIYVEVLPEVTFISDFGGTLQGETVQSVKNYEDLVVPTPVAGENYKFYSWVPEIPKSGKIEKNMYFRATYTYIPPLSEVQAEKKYELQRQAAQETQDGVEYKEETFPYTEPDKNEILTKLETAIKLDMSVIVYMSNQIQMELTRDEITDLYRQEEYNAISHNAYLYQMFLYVDSLKSSELVRGVSYGQDLEGEYLENYNTAVDQEKAIIEKYIEFLSNSGGGASPDVSKLKEEIAALTDEVNNMKTAVIDLQTDLTSINEVLMEG